VELGHPPADPHQRVQVRQAVRQIRQHAHERHHVLAGRVAGEPQADTRGAGVDQRRRQVVQDELRAAAEQDETADGGRETVPLVPHSGEGDRRHVPLPDSRHQGALPAAGARRQAGVDAELQPAAAVRPQVQEPQSEEPGQVRVGAEAAAQPAGRHLPASGLRPVRRRSGRRRGTDSGTGDADRGLNAPCVAEIVQEGAVRRRRCATRAPLDQDAGRDRTVQGARRQGLPGPARQPEDGRLDVGRSGRVQGPPDGHADDGSGVVAQRTSHGQVGDHEAPAQQQHGPVQQAAPHGRHVAAR
jgi:hypothetical protein